MENLVRTDRMRTTEALKEKGVRWIPHPYRKERDKLLILRWLGGSRTHSSLIITASITGIPVQSKTVSHRFTWCCLPPGALTIELQANILFLRAPEGIRTPVTQIKSLVPNH